jgi:hypothetical protein
MRQTLCDRHPAGEREGSAEAMKMVALSLFNDVEKMSCCAA